MARIRTIKPEFPEDEKLGACSRDARLLFVLIWTLCDDHGRFRASAVFLRTHLYPYDLDIGPHDVAAWLEELTAKRRVQLYEVDGETYGHVVNWPKHQRVDNAGKPLYPDPPRLAANHGEPDEPAAGPGPRPGPPTTDPREPQSAATAEPVDRDLGMVWQILAKRARAACTEPVRSPARYEAKAARNAEHEHADRARELVDQYPDLTDTQLADVLAGADSILRVLPRRSA